MVPIEKHDLASPSSPFIWFLLHAQCQPGRLVGVVIPSSHPCVLFPHAL